MNFTARILNFSLMFVMPIGLGIYLARKLKSEWRLFGIGVITFIVSQVFHIPFNYWILSPLLENLGFSLNQQGLQLALIGLFYGLSAGIFEEITRYLGFRWWIKEERDWKSALMYGTGHGGIEAVIIGVFVMWAFIQAISLRGTDLSIVVDADQIEIVRAQLADYWAAPWHMAILGAVERMATIPFHISASVIILQSFRRNKFSWVFLAVGWHTAVDAIAVFASQTWSLYVTEGIILLLGIMSIVIIFVFKSTDMLEIKEKEPPLPAMPEIEKETLSQEDLEDSRYA